MWNRDEPKHPHKMSTKILSDNRDIDWNLKKHKEGDK